MNHKLSRWLLVPAFALGAVQGTFADCVPVSGKISNNGQVEGGAFTTLGVASLTVGNSKMKCGLVGIIAPPGADDGNPYTQEIAFTHTLSCDDKVSTPFGAAHSQLTFDTSGVLLLSEIDGCFIPFLETTSPQAGSGRGALTGVAGGAITVTGAINTCLGSIDMNAEGELCW